MKSPSIRNIFLAEDDSDDVYMFKEALAAVNLEVNLHTAKDGAAFMNLINGTENLPDLVFLDLNMPFKNGFTCLQEIRKNRNLEKVPVAILSTSRDRQTIDQAYEYKANAYIPKPSVFGELKTVLEYCLQRSWREEPPPPRENFLIVS